jgi:hypothetical protein
MKRLAGSSAVLALVLCATIVGPADIANASPRNTTSITLSCDKNVDASASLTLQPSASDATSLGQVVIECGPTSNVGRQRNRVEVPTGALAAGWLSITSWTNSTDASTAGCAGSGEIVFKATCTNDAGVGSELTVR